MKVPVKAELREFLRQQHKSISSNAYIGILYLDNTRIGTVINNGRGMTAVTPHLGKEKLLEQFKDDLLKDPERWVFNPISSDEPGKMEEFALASYLDKLAFIQVREAAAQENNRMALAAMPNHIVFGVPGQGAYTHKLDNSISTLVKSEEGRKQLIEIMKAIIPAMVARVKILNNNLPADLMDKIGRENFNVLQAPDAAKTNGKSKSNKLGK